MSAKVKRAILDVTWENLPDLALPEDVRIVHGLVSLEKGGLSLMLEGDGLPDCYAGMLGSGSRVKTIRIRATSMQVCGVSTGTSNPDEVPLDAIEVGTRPFFITRFERWE